MHKTCTILFADLVESTELRTSLGDDQFDVRRRAHDHMLAETIERHHGEVVKFGGDGSWLCSARPPTRCHARLRYSRLLPRDRGHEQSLTVRVGVSAGDVVEEQGDFHGTPVVEASRLCGVALGGQVLAADVVRVLAGTRGGHARESIEDQLDCPFRDLGLVEATSDGTAFPPMTGV